MSQIPEPLFFLVFQILPYVTYIVFTSGVLVNIVKWASAPSGGSSVLSEAIPPKSMWIQTVSQFIYLIVLQGRFLRKKLSSLTLWLTSAPMHLTLLFIVFGHFRAIGVWSAEQFTWLMPREFMVITLPLIVGIILMVEVILLTLRRLIDPKVRAISTWLDYSILALFLLHVFTGNVMRLLPKDPVPLEVMIAPFMTMSLEDTPSPYWLALHTASAQVFIMYVPFSKVIHMIGGVVTMWMSSVRHVRLMHR